ncbi:MAG: cytochrome b [Calothrix sp. SM1_5_4]|nr:cytochrome b [Calothrix sp. SM1_5_4]
MSRRMVYDAPTRVLHALFALLFIIAFTIAKTVDHESLTFSYHMLAGLTLSFVACLRIAWGLVGTRYARFRSLPLRPSELKAYFISIFSGQTKTWSGHNPASGWSAILFIGLALAMGLSGLMMSAGLGGHTLEDLHELMANSFALLALIHIAGIAVHSLRHNDPIALSMIDGKKNDVPEESAIREKRASFALAAIALVLATALHLIYHFDPSTRNSIFRCLSPVRGRERIVSKCSRTHFKTPIPPKM